MLIESAPCIGEFGQQQRLLAGEFCALREITFHIFRYSLRARLKSRDYGRQRIVVRGSKQIDKLLKL